MADIDRLEVGVEASAAKADAELDKLIRRLEKVSDNLTRINSGGLTGFAKGIENLGKSMQTVNSTKTSDFTRLTKNIQKIADVDSAALNRTASSLNIIAKSLNNTGASMKSSESIATLSSNLGKLGGKSIEKAIVNLPKLASELKNLMTTLSQSPNVSKNVIQMTNALANLSNSMKGIRNGSTSTASSSTSAGGVKKLSDAFSRLSGNVTKSRKTLSSFSQLAGKFYADCFMLIRALKKLGNAIVTSMDYVETYNYFSVTMDKIGREFGNMYEQYGYDSAEAYANSFSGRLNELTRKMTGYSVGSNGELTMTGSIGLALDPQAIQNYQASIAAVTNSVGLLGENSVNVSKALTMLAADMSSLKNVDLSTAMTNFQSGLIGQSRALYKYGIDITNNTLQTYAYGLGLQKAVSEMTQAEKMQLRMIAILDQSKVAWGDQARTINSVANQYRIMKQQISNLARVIGNLFLPIVQKVLPVVNGLVIALQRLFNALGFKLWGGNWLKDTMEGISGGGAPDGIFDGLEEDADDYADSLGTADKAAKKLSATLLGFDQINKLTDNDTGASSGSDAGSGGEIDLSDAIGEALADYESVWDAALDDSKNKAQEYADSITATFNRIWKAIEPFRKSVKRLWDEGLNLLIGYSFQNLKDFYNEFLVPIGTWAFGTEGSGLTRLVDIINNQLMRIDWPWISENLKEFWRAIEPYAEQFGEGLIDFFEDISGVAVDVINLIFGRDGAIVSITDWLDNHDEEKARKWGYALGELAIGLMALKGVGAIVSSVVGIGTKLSEFASGISSLFGADGVFTSIKSGISGLFTDGIFSSSSIGAVAGIAAAVVVLATGLTYVFTTNEKVRQSFSDAIASIREGLQPAIEFMTGTVLPGLQSAWQGLMDTLSPLGEFLEGAFTSIWQDIINPALTSIGEDVLPKLTEAFENLWNNVLVPLGELLRDVLAPVIQIVSDVLSLLWKNVVLPLAEAIGTVLLAGFNSAIDTFGWVTESVKVVIKTFQFLWNEVFSPIVSYLWEKFKPAFENVFKVIGGIIDGLGTALGGLIDFVSGIFTANWEKAWKGIGDVFRGVFNGIVSVAEGVINSIINGINRFLDGFNGIVTSVGDIIGIDISLPVIHTVELPRFANGGYPNTGELFLARENGINEMVGRIGSRSAVANNDQIVEAITNSVAPAVYEAVTAAFVNNGIGSGNQALPVEVEIKADTETLYKAVKKGEMKHDRRYHVVADF